MQGVDVWLNNPRRPLEASGTSGMKVCCNGGLNLSVLDGWWDEGYDGENGWAIGAGEEYTDLTYQDDVEAGPFTICWSRRSCRCSTTVPRDGLPRGWLKRMKRSMMTLCPVFNTSRMVAEYLTTCYLPSAQRFMRLTGDNLQKANALAQWRQTLQRGWGQVKVEGVEVNGADPMQVGGELPVKVRVNLGRFSPEDVEVQLFHGLVDSLGDIPRPQSGGHESQRQAEARQRLGVPRRHSLPIERPARFRGARAAAPRRPGQLVRAGIGVLGIRGNLFG